MKKALRTLKTLTLVGLVCAAAALNTGCDTEDISPGHKGFMFDRTGFLAGYSGGEGLETDKVLEPGTHFMGVYDELRVVDCRDQHVREQVEVLTQSDITVTIDLRLTYAADCRTGEHMQMLINEVTTGPDHIVKPEKVYELYVLPIVRESLRNYIADITIEDVKRVRLGLRDQVLEELQTSIREKNNPVVIKIVAVSSMTLPTEIVDKNRQIELARQDAELQTEEQKTAKVRLERELFEAQEDRKVQRETAEKERDVKLIRAEAQRKIALIEAETERDARKLEAAGIKDLRAQLTRDYVAYVKVLKDAEVAEKQAGALGEGTVYYMGADFLVPPGARASVSASK